MALTTVSLDKNVYRASSFQYFSKSLSPAGSRKAAGRFNRSGVSALYLALEPETALAEYWQGPAPTPVALIPVSLTVQRVVDLGSRDSLAALELRLAQHARRMADRPG